MKGKHTNVLGIVTPHDINMLEHESQTGRGWIARTTDAVSLEKPQYYDLIDLTSYAPTERRATPPCSTTSVPEPRAVGPSSTIYSSSTQIRTASRARIVHRPRSGRVRKRGACTRTCASSVRGPSPAYGAAAVPMEPNGPRDQWSWAGSPRERSARSAHVRYVRKETASMGAWRRIAHTTTMRASTTRATKTRIMAQCWCAAGKRARWSHFCKCSTRRRASSSPASSLPDARLTPRNLLA
ncbi:hypothetical protein EDB89DRAFT_994994 [Lactarius sanguifluus]|nr:hypothetical protein EDB89DRAFT_994994 [Lactarius sanguifluus]